jgi:phi13 family phage major tail protein
MAKIGLKHVVGGVLNDSGSTPTYTGGRVLGKAISASLSFEFNEATLFADDAVAEKVREFKSGKLTLGTDDLTYEVQGMLLGHTATATSLKKKATDVAPYVGVGFCGTVIRNDVRKYRAIWLWKVKFGVPNEELKTKGESIEFTTPSIEGTVLKIANEDYHDEMLAETEEEAIQWLDTKAGIAEEA